MQSSRALVLFGVSCMRIGLVVSDENAPALALYVPPAGLRPVPGPQTKPEAPVAPAAPVASPSFMMPMTMESPGSQMPVGQPLMDTTPQFLSVVETPSSPFASLAGFVGGLVAGGAVVYSLLNKAGQKVSVETQNLELGALRSRRAGVPTMMADDVEAKVTAIIAEQLGVEAASVKPDSSFTEDLGADSLDAVELIMAIEEAFDIEIPDEEAETMTTPGDCVTAIKGKL